MNAKIIRPSQITVALLSKSSPTEKVRITTVGWNRFDLHRKSSVGYRLENVTQGCTQDFVRLTDLKFYISCHK